MVPKTNTLAILALLAGAPLAAAAQTLPPPVVGGAYLDEMARMDAELQLLRKRQEVRQAQDALNGTSASPAQMPKVLAIYMSEGRLAAEIMYAHGLVTRVRGGETIPGDIQIVSVGPKGVTVRVAGAGKKSVLDYAVRTSVTAPVESVIPMAPPAPMAMPAAAPSAVR